MAEIVTKRWIGESLRMTLTIDENNSYVSYMNSNDKEKFIESIDLSRSDGNSSVNPLGVASSNSISIVLFDINDDLSPASMTSKYSGKITNGLKIQLEKTSDFGETWDKYGVYYTTNISGGYSDGYYTTVSIQAEDRLNILGNTLVPELDVYANIEVGDLIVALFTALGFSSDEYYIDPKLDTSFLWGILPNTKVRDFMNSVCQRMLARVIVDNQGVIRWIPALELPTLYNTLEVGPDLLVSLRNNNASNINYSKVSVSYYVYGQEEEVSVYTNRNISLVLGHNIINNITFGNDVLCITNVDIQYKSEFGLGKVENVKYVAFQSGMVLECDVTGSSVFGVNIKVEGVVISQLTNKVSVDLNTATRIGLTEYTFDAKSRMTEAEATALCSKIVDYIETLRNTITISGTVITPDLNIGDEFIISGTNTMYEGSYKVIKQSITFSETYSQSVTLLRIGGVESGS